MAGLGEKLKRIKHEENVKEKKKQRKTKQTQVEPDNGYNEDLLHKAQQQMMEMNGLNDLAEMNDDKDSLGERMYDIEDIEVKTRISSGLALAITSAKAYARVYKRPIFEEITNDLMALLISKDGEGRKEAVEISRGNNLMMPYGDFDRTQK